MSNIKILTNECIEVKGGLGILTVVYIFQSVLHHTIDVSEEFCLPLVFVKYNRTRCFKYINFMTEDSNSKHTNITTIYRDK